MKNKLIFIIPIITIIALAICMFCFIQYDDECCITKPNISYTLNCDHAQIVDKVYSNIQIVISNHISKYPCNCHSFENNWVIIDNDNYKDICNGYSDVIIKSNNIIIYKYSFIHTWIYKYANMFIIGLMNDNGFVYKYVYITKYKDSNWKLQLSEY